MVHTGSPPCLKWGLAADAPDAIRPRANRLITSSFLWWSWWRDANLRGRFPPPRDERAASRIFGALRLLCCLDSPPFVCPSAAHVTWGHEGGEQDESSGPAP